MKRNKLKLRILTSVEQITKFNLLLFFICFALPFTIKAQTPQIWPAEISFNFESGNANDAIQIKENAANTISAPEYIKDSKNENCAYIKSQGNRKIKVKFGSNNSNMNYLVKATVISGTGLGNICEMFVAACDLNSTVFTIDLQGSVPGTVGKNTFTWKWEATALPVGSPYCPVTCTYVNTQHTFYTLFAIPLAPMTEPWTQVLDYACVWASGDNDANTICNDILDNGFYEHYTWNGNCHNLSSDFVRLVLSLGINATMHKWASISSYIEVGDMIYQRTKSIDPVGSTWGQGIIEWYWHQWAEAESIQRDPSTGTNIQGDWGVYEDDLFTHYLVKGSSTSWWTLNQNGQASGCEASSHRIYNSYPTNNILYDWRGPDR